MQRTFEIRTEPHQAVIGDVTLLLEPEIEGARFATAYDKLRTVQTKVNASKGNKASSTKHAKDDGLDAATLTELSSAMREFIDGFLLPESRAVFESMRLPDRVLIQLMEYAAELYGGGSGNQGAVGGTSSG